MDHLPIRVQHACLEPLVDQSQKRAVVNALGKHLEQPLVVEVVEEALDVGFDHIVVVPELQLDGQLVHAVQGSNVRSVAITAAQEVRLKDRFQDALDRQLQQLVLSGRYPQGAQSSVALGDVLPSDELGVISLPFETLDQSSDVLRQVLLVLCRAHSVDAVGGIFANVAPTVV